jgi:HAD superfamily hydrolase (TIGR01549 family)
MADTAIFDVDGTLVDSNYQHALAWHRAFRRHDLAFALWRIHRLIGMGGDQFVPEIAGQDVERRLGEALREAWSEEFDKLIDEVEPFEGARDLLVEVKRRGFRVVLASSGKQQHVEHFLDLIGGRDVAETWTTSDDVERSKPEPDLVRVALGKVDGASGAMLGDSVWDVEAAKKLGVPTVGLRSGGYSPEELTDAGAIQVYDSLPDLLADLDNTPFGRPDAGTAKAP